ncbi:protein CLEC16A-like isoform X2 [Glandiceps talaboti]
MFSKGKNWIQQAVWKPKNLHSLEHLKFLYHVLSKNQMVTEQNKSLLVETLRSISEILIWGDQNDSTVFDFFLEKNMLAFFIKILRQRTGRYVCVQILQTLNILFENIRNETSLYYLLSNNHVNCIIVHKFDFSDEEILAYYISFLKTLSLKLNSHTIHFFYNEHTNDFALYTEAIKFFNHPESMVRIAVRTLTLNVYKVNDKAMLMYIGNRTAAPYFSNLVWFIGNHVLELDSCVRNDTDHQSRNRLSDLVAEHLDHLHYLNDIFHLNIDRLNEILSDQLLNRLLIPLYIYSLTKDKRYDQQEDKPHVHSVVALFLLSQVFLILSHFPVITTLADMIINCDIDTVSSLMTDIGEGEMSKRGFVAPSETLEKSLESSKISSAPYPPRRAPRYRDSSPEDDEGDAERRATANSQQQVEDDDDDDDEDEEKFVDTSPDVPSSSGSSEHGFYKLNEQNSTDEEKSHAAIRGVKDRPYWTAIVNTLNCNESDYKALFTLCLMYAMGNNTGVNPSLLDTISLPSKREDKSEYSVPLVERLITIMSQSCQFDSRVRPATLQMAIVLLKQLVYKDKCYLQDMHLACIEGAREESKLLLRNYYKGDELFLDMFEDEYKNLKMRPLNVEFLMMDSSILLPPTGTPLTGIEFAKRLPSGDLERTRRAIRVFFLLRDLSLTLSGEEENRLPLTKQEELVKVADKLDLNNRDLIACTVVHKDKVTTPKKQRRFLVIDPLQLILVEPDTKKLGWGVASFVGPLQDVEVTGDKDDSRSLRVTIHKRANSSHVKPTPLLAARFIFDDHIRCMAAKQRLSKGRTRARHRKMECIAILLDLPVQTTPGTPQTPTYPPSLHQVTSHPGMAVPANAVPSQQPQPFRTYSDQTFRRSGHQPSDQSIPRSVFASVDKLPTFAAAEKRSTDFVRQVPAASADFPGVRMSAPIPVRPSPTHSSHNRPQPMLPGGRFTSSPEIEQAQEATSPSAFTKEGVRGQSSMKAVSQREHTEWSNHSEPHLDSENPSLSPSLVPAKAPTTSLLTDGEDPNNGSGSPKILPPTSAERVRSLSNSSADGTAFPPEGFEDGRKLGFGKTQAAVDVNKASAQAPLSPGRSRLTDLAKESLTRLAHHREKKVISETDGIEMTSFNVTTMSSSVSPTDGDRITAAGLEGSFTSVSEIDPNCEIKHDNTLPERKHLPITSDQTTVLQHQEHFDQVIARAKESEHILRTGAGKDSGIEESETDYPDDLKGAVGGIVREIESDHSSDFDTAMQDLVQSQLMGLPRDNQTVEMKADSIDPESDYQMERSANEGNMISKENVRDCSESQE